MWYNRWISKATAQSYLPVAWPQPSGVRSDMPIILSSGGIYKITCTANGKVYIGSTTDMRKRWRAHRSDLRNNKHHNRHLQGAWNKYGNQFFEFEVLETVTIADHLHEREQHWLDHYQAYNPDNGYNHGTVARAPWLGRSHSSATKQKLSDSAKAHSTIDQARQFADEWHGSEAGIVWHREHGKQTWVARAVTTKVCAYCEAEFTTRDARKTTRFCSNNCRTQARRISRVDNEDRVCVRCGAVFSTSRYLKAKCCSLSCAAYLRHYKGRQP